MAREIELNGRRYWILSEPHADGWRAWVVQVTAEETREEIGIDATGETRGAADTGAERKLRRLLQFSDTK